MKAYDARRATQADRCVLGMVVTILGIQVWLALIDASWWLLIPMIVALRWQHLAEHTHVHRPLVHKPLGRRIVDFGLVMSTAVPVDIYYTHHVATHHRYNNSADDWTSPFAYASASFPDQPVPLLRYVASFPYRSWIFSIRDLRATSGRGDLCGSVLVLLAGSATIFMASPTGFLKFFLVPWLALYFLAPVANWLHHYNCLYEDWQSSANSKLSLLNRSIGLNIGYHAAHHVYPDAHWSELPLLHAGLSASDRT